MLLAGIFCFGQGNIYTRKVRLEDFPAKTTKVVAEGNSILSTRLREEVTAHWRVSPYEFCSAGTYESFKNSTDYYFLQMMQRDGVAFLVLSKGGRPDAEDPYSRPFNVVEVPVLNIGDPSGSELAFMGAFIDIIQKFVEDAMLSDRIAYGGLDRYNRIKLNGKKVCLDPDLAVGYYMAKEPDSLIGVVIAPSEPTSATRCYKMLISADTNELYFYKEQRFRSGGDGEFSQAEIRQFRKRNAIIL